MGYGRPDFCTTKLNKNYFRGAAVNAQEVFLTPAQIAGKYPVSKSTVYSACQDGLIPH